MGMLQKLTGWARGNNVKGYIQVRQAAGSYVIPSTVGRPQFLSTRIETYDREGYRKVALIFRCIQYISNAAGSAPLRVYREAHAQREELPDHPLRALLARPNPEMGEARFWSMIAMLMNVTGTGFIEIERSKGGQVIGLWPLRSDWMVAIPVQNQLPDWEYRIPGLTPKYLKSDRVIVVPYSDTPTLDYRGVGPLEAAIRELSIANALTDFLKAFFDRGAMPLYVAYPSDDPELAKQWEDEATREAFKEKFRQTYGGLNHALDVTIPFGIKEIKALGFNFDELAYPELRNLSDAAICSAFGIPPVLVGAQVGLDRATFNNTTEMRKSFYEDTMTYLWARLDDAFTRHLLPAFEADPGFSIEFDLSEIPAFQDNKNEQWLRATSAFSAGMISRHVGQREIGVEPHGPDVFLQSFSVTEVPVGESNKRAAKKPSASIEDPKSLPSGEKRGLPPNDPDDTDDGFSHNEVEDALDYFDEVNPDLAGLLRAKTVRRPKDD